MSISSSLLLKDYGLSKIHKDNISINLSCIINLSAMIINSFNSYNSLSDKT